MVYSEHVLERLHKPGAMLLECSYSSAAWNPADGVPDATLYIEAYASERLAFFFEELKHLGGAVEPLSNPSDVINQMFRTRGKHLFAWNSQACSTILKNIGSTTCHDGTLERHPVRNCAWTILPTPLRRSISNAVNER